MLLGWLKATGRVCTLFLGVFAFAAAAQAGPKDGRIVNGSGSISQSGTHTDIHQNSDFLATRWDSFNIATHESVQAHQPSSTARLLIRVDGSGGTDIAGSYTSNGITILENQNGVQFSRGAIINVGGLLATSSRISGVGGNHWQLNGVGGAVVNHGQIVAGAGGAILAAVKVQNTGDITAKGGDVALGAGSSFTVDFAGSMVGFEVEQAASGASITNTGKIEAQGGVVALSAQEAQAVRTNVVSVGGVVKATKLERRGGVVYLSGGDEGVAEVSGDVQADEKVQTTGGYVVVKEGALLKAPEILVGGDFQGRGDVQTAKRTLVEAGAQLNAGANGRVIVWSDETTWFNGNITAPGGFAEVSGKEVLASVNLAGIDVGALLLDPADIIIAATGTAFTDSIASGDPPSGTLTLAVGDINSFPGDLSLAASDSITVEVAILKPTGGLTLTAGGVLTISANITTSAGALVLSGSGIVLGGDITLSAASVGLTGAINASAAGHSFTVTASGDITLNSNINLGQGALDLRAGVDGESTVNDGNISNGSGPDEFGDAREIRAGSLHLQQDDYFDGNLFAQSSDITGAVDIRLGKAGPEEATATVFGGEFWIDNLGEGDLTISGIEGVVINFILTLQGIGRSQGELTLVAKSLVFGTVIRGRAFTLRADTINFLTFTATNGDLTFTRADGTGRPTLNSAGGNITLRQNSAFGAEPPFIINEALNARLLLETAAPQILQPWMVSAARGLSLISGGVLTINADIIATGDDSVDAITLSGTSIVLTRDINLTGTTVTLTGVIDASEAGHSLTIMASAVLTLNSNINLGAGNLTLQGTDELSSGGNLRSEGMALGSDVRLEGGEISLSGTIDESASGNGGNENLTILASGALTLNSNINTGTGALTLSGAPISLDSAVDTLRGGVVSITGTIDRGTGNLTITASGALTINNNIDTGTGNLTLTAGMGDTTGDISNGGGTRTLTAGTVSLTQDGTSAFGPTDWVIASNTLILNTAAAQTVHSWMTASGRNLSLTTTGVLTINEDAINLGGGNLTLSGSRIAALNAAGLTLTAAAVELTGVLNTSSAAVDGAPVTITASGAITLNNNIVTNLTPLTLTAASIVVNRNVRLAGGTINFNGEIDGTTCGGCTLRAIGRAGDITFNENIDFGTGVIILLATGGNIASGSTPPIINSRNFVVRQEGAFSADLFSEDSLITNAVRLFINDATATQTIHPWLATLSGSVFALGGFNATLASITTTTAITNSNRIELRAATITLGGVLTSANVSLRTNMIAGTVDIRATTGNIAATDIIAAGAAGTGVPTLAPTVTALTFETAATQTYATWMRGDAGVANFNLSLTSTGGAVIVNDNINIGTGNLTLNGMGGITLGGSGVRELIGGVISLTGSINSSDTNNVGLFARATGALTINSNINIGTGALTLNGATITLGGTGRRRLIGGAISLTGAIDASGTNVGLLARASGALTINNDINTGTGALTLEGASIATTNVAGLMLTGGAVELTGVLNTSNAAEGGAPVTITASGTLTLNNNIVTNLTPLTLTAASIVLNRTVRLAGGTIEFNGEIDGTTCGGCTLRAIGRAGNITFNNNVDLGTGVIILLATGGNIASGSTPPIMKSRNFVVRQEAAFSADLFSEDSLITNAVRLFINDASATQTIHPWLATLSGSVFALGGFNATLASITTTTPITNNNRIELRAALITLGGVITSAAVVLRTNMIAGMVDIRATTGNIAATNIIAAGAEGTGVPTLAPTVTALTLETAAPLTYAAWMRGDAGATNFNLSLTSTGGAITINEAAIDLGTGDLTLDGMGGITFTNAAGLTIMAGAVSFTGAITASNFDLRVAANGVATLNSDIDLGTGTLVLSGTSGITLGGTGTRQFTGGTVTLTGVVTASNTNIDLRVVASNVLTVNDNIDIGAGDLTLSSTASLAFAPGVELTLGSFSFTPTRTCDGSTINPRCIITP